MEANISEGIVWWCCCQRGEGERETFDFLRSWDGELPTKRPPCFHSVQPGSRLTSDAKQPASFLSIRPHH